MSEKVQYTFPIFVFIDYKMDPDCWNDGENYGKTIDKNPSLIVSEEIETWYKCYKESKRWPHPMKYVNLLEIDPRTPVIWLPELGMLGIMVDSDQELEKIKSRCNVAFYPERNYA